MQDVILVTPLGAENFLKGDFIIWVGARESCASAQLFSTRLEPGLKAVQQVAISFLGITVAPLQKGLVVLTSFKREGVCVRYSRGERTRF